MTLKKKISKSSFSSTNNNNTLHTYTHTRILNKKEMNDAAAATFDAVSDGVSDVKDAVGKYLQFDANKANFFVKLRKNLDVKFPGTCFQRTLSRRFWFLVFGFRSFSLCLLCIRVVLRALVMNPSDAFTSLSLFWEKKLYSHRAHSKLEIPSWHRFELGLSRRQPIHGLDGGIHSKFAMVV